MTLTENISTFSMDRFSLKGKVAIITGATGSLGMGYALAFAKAGADLFVPCHKAENSELRKLIEAEGRRIEFIRGDLGDRKHIDEIVQGCLDAYGHIDILVNNSGTNHFEDFETFPDEEFQRVLGVNLHAVYYLGHEVAKVMIRQGTGGKIINIGSALSYTADGMCPPYITAKHGVIGITRCFANELGKYNIQCNAICPGFFATSVNSDISDNKEFFDYITNRTPQGRWGNPDDLMGAAVFLASPASDFINGADLKIDGGFSCKL